MMSNLDVNASIIDYFQSGFPYKEPYFYPERGIYSYSAMRGALQTYVDENKEDWKEVRAIFLGLISRKLAREKGIKSSKIKKKVDVLIKHILIELQDQTFSPIDPEAPTYAKLLIKEEALQQFRNRSIEPSMVQLRDKKIDCRTLSSLMAVHPQNLAIQINSKFDSEEIVTETREWHRREQTLKGFTRWLNHDQARELGKLIVYKEIREQVLMELDEIFDRSLSAKL